MSNWPPLPFSYEAIVMVTNMFTMMLVTPTLNPPPYLTGWWMRVGRIVFWASLVMLCSNSWLWWLKLTRM